MEQKDLDRKALQVEQALRQLGLPIGKVVSVTVNPRLKSTLGRTRNNPYRIEVAQAITTDEDLLANTLFHEYLHTLPGCMNHGRTWKAAADLVNARLGTHITVRAAASPLPARYELVCLQCGQTISRQKLCPLIKNPRRYRCRCGGKLKRIK